GKRRIVSLSGLTRISRDLRMSGSREEERRKLADIINHWNANRLDLFEISQPTEDLEFHGVMRFYFQDRVAGNFATKCIRVSSTATTQDVIETLAEKFRPDMRMLSSPKYSLYEVHVSGEERKLDLDEKPLVVQLNWNKDDREGRFVLKNENDIMPKKSLTNGPEKEKEGVIQNFKRTLSKKEKKKEKKREKEAFSRIPDGDDHTLNREDGENSRLAAEVYKDMPETSFTRTISNPEVVMKRRRQQKLEKRMQEFRSGDGRPDSGGTLRIYADSLKPNIPYKTILLSTTDMADFAVAEALEKYGLEKENPRDYCIAQVIHANDKPVKETILDDTDCPLQILRDWTSDKEALVFQLKKRPPDYAPRKGRKPDNRMGPPHGSIPPEKLPYLVELSPDGSDSRDKPKLYRLQHSLTEVGSDRSEEGNIQLFGPGILPHHCELMHEDGLVTVTPVSLDAETFVDGQRISDTTVLRSGVTVQFGATHVFKFVDPINDHSMSKRDPGPMMKGRHKSGVPETTFDLHGDFHSGSALPTSKSSGKLVMERSGNSERGLVKPMIRGEQQDFNKHDGRSQDGPELTLPASIEFRENSEDAFLSAIINYTNSSTVHFKLSPTYVLYMTCRYVMSSQYRPDISPSERTHKFIAIVNKMVSMMEGVIQKQKNIAGALAFWMANASELLNFIKQDKDLSRITLDAQDVLAHLVQMAFKYLVHCLQSDLNNYMPAFLEDPDEQNPQRPKIEDVLHTLTGAMSLLRRCRVNAALTIQLFSQLFHFINMWLFNKLVTEADSGLCSHYWGAILRQQLSHIEAWAEKQGLELAADCHLSRIVQATTLLTMDKYSMQDVQNINNTCFKLNSLQLNALLSNYHCAPDEPYIPPELIDHVVTVAENTADELARSDGREVQLEEDPDLQLPFLLPEDGYSCDVVRNIPNGFQEFLEPLCQRGFCRLTPHPRSPGTWTIYFEGADCDRHFSADTSELPMQKEPEIVTVTLKKHNGMGLSIVAAKGAGQDKLGIYIKSVVKGGAADVDGRLAAGDQLLSVDGRSLVGLSQERAAELMTRTGSVVTLEVAKQGAIYHGLATLLNQPSPMMPRASDRGQAYPIPTQTYPREYFTFPASKSQDRMGPGQPWQNNELEPLPPMDNHSNNSMAMQRVARSQEELCDMPGGYPGEHLRQEDLMHLQQQREAEYQRGGGEHWNHQMSSSVESSTSSQEHLNYSSSSGSRIQGNHKSGPGRWKTPIAPHSGPVGASQPSRSDLPPPPPPPPAHYDYEPQTDMPLPPPPSITQQQAAAAAATADRKKREEQQRWYEKEKARLEEERERKRRDQERKLVQIRNPPGPVMHNNQHGPLPPAPQHQQMPHPQLPMQLPQPPQPQPARPDKLSSLPRQPPQDTVIRDLLPQQQPRTIERRDLQYITISKEELSASDSLSPDPWKRDAREKLEKQQQLHIVDLLDKEIQELQAKPERTAEENDRLRKLMLEWQFQKRLQESKQNEEDEEEEDDEDVDTTLIMQRLEAEKRARLQDEERRRKQQLEEVRKREAEERAKQEEERRWREEERARREAEEKVLRSKRTSVMELSFSVDNIDFAWFQLCCSSHSLSSVCLLSLYVFGIIICLAPPTLPCFLSRRAAWNHGIPQPLPSPSPRRSFAIILLIALEITLMFLVKFTLFLPFDKIKTGFNSYTGNTTGLGSGEIYKDPREKWTKSGPDQENTIGGAPESLTFKERQRLFSQGKEVSNKVKASRKLMELENELNIKQ
uniref:Afadin n=1 Tax=Sinocyclocheilus rhinocerous TaxID=307959 RepID=A0A673IUK4_9TELE